jgi:DNA repair exonuclease SbcCD ATPase subunit
MVSSISIKLLAFFQDNGTPKTGLSPTIEIYDLATNAKVITAGALEEVGGGFYKYLFVNYNENTNYAYIVDGGATLGLHDRYKFNGNSLNIVEQRMTGVEDDLRQIRNFFRQFKDDHASMYGFLDDIKKRDIAGPIMKEISRLSKDGEKRITGKDVEAIIDKAVGKIKIPDQGSEIVAAVRKEFVAEIESKVKPILNRMDQYNVAATLAQMKKQVDTIKVPTLNDYAKVIAGERARIMEKYKDSDKEIAELMKSSGSLKADLGALKNDIANLKATLSVMLSDIKGDVVNVVKLYRLVQDKGRVEKLKGVLGL